MKRMLCGWLLLILSMQIHARLVSDGGDHAGNGGFTDVKGKKLLKIASASLIEDIDTIDYQLFLEHPEYQDILLDVLVFENLQLKQNDTRLRNGRRLMLDYEINPNSIIILHDFFLSFAGTSDDHMISAVKEVKLLLLHEASHIWGYNEQESRVFSHDLLSALNNPTFDQRPTLFDFTKSCLCHNGVEGFSTLRKASCRKICSEATDQSLSIFAIADIPQENGSPIHNLYEWCFDEIPGGATGPDCIVELKLSEEGDKENLRPIFISENFIQIPLKDYDIDVGDQIEWSIVSLSLSSNSRSLLQDFKVLEDDTVYDMPKVTRVKQYACFEYGDDTLVRLFFYYPEYSPPEAIPLDFRDKVFCHDQDLYGNADSILFPRLWQMNAFSLWSLLDPLMGKDLDINGVLDINDLIGKLTNSSVNVFKIRSMKRVPHRSPKSLGVYMSSFQDEKGLNFCPQLVSNPAETKGKLLKTIAKIIQVDTEPIFQAEPQDIYSKDGWMDVSLSQVSGALFTVDNGRLSLVGDDERHGKALFYYWPIDRNSPLIKKSGQVLYRIKSDFGDLSSDKSYGCVPIVEDLDPSPVPDLTGGIGESCSSDYECTSLCCNEKGRCAAHGPTGGGGMCSKAPGLSCISSEFCRIENVKQCFIINTGFNSSGDRTCSLRCYDIPMSGTCENLTCVPPRTPQVPDFNPNNPDCSSAIDSPIHLKEIK